MTVPRGLLVGLATVDVVQRVSRFPRPDEKVVAIRTDVAAGGPATGAAIAFAGLGGNAALLTAVGNGPLAPVVRADLEAHRVRLHDAAPHWAGLPVSTVTVLDGTGERAVVSRNAEGVDAAAPPDLAALAADADVVLVDGHHPALALAAAIQARALGVPVVLDAGSWKQVLADLLPLVDAAVCSAAFRDEQGHPAGPRLLAAGPRFVAVTAGPSAIHWWTSDGSGAVEVPSTPAADTLGAGDVFHGAFAYALAAGVDPVPALERAARVAVVRVSHVGPRAWLADPRLRPVATGECQ